MLGSSSLTPSGPFLSPSAAIIISWDLHNHSCLVMTSSAPSLPTPILHAAMSICPVKTPMASCGQWTHIACLVIHDPPLSSIHSFYLQLPFPPAHSFHLPTYWNPTHPFQPRSLPGSRWPAAPQLLYLRSQSSPSCDGLCVRSPRSSWAARGTSVAAKGQLAYQNCQTAPVHAGVSYFPLTRPSDVSALSCPVRM